MYGLKLQGIVDKGGLCWHHARGETPVKKVTVLVKGLGSSDSSKGNSERGSERAKRRAGQDTPPVATLVGGIV